SVFPYDFGQEIAGFVPDGIEFHTHRPRRSRTDIQAEIRTFGIGPALMTFLKIGPLYPEGGMAGFQAGSLFRLTGKPLDEPIRLSPDKDIGQPEINRLEKLGVVCL